MYAYTDEMYHAAMNVLDTRADQLGYEDSDELYHHGILGMKWGVRKYQNEDGSLTPEGERRYAKLSDREHKESINSLERANNMGRRGLLPAVLSVPHAAKEVKRLKNMSDEEFEENYANEVAKRKKGAKFNGGMIGAALGTNVGALMAIPVREMTGSPTATLGAGILGMALGGVGGAAIGSSISGNVYDRRHEKYMNMEDLKYHKRNKKELAEYDREHANQ